MLARKIYESPIPVISAVGHETDFTICDFVSDLRAPTPSAAAELAVPDINEITLKINSFNTSLKNSLLAKYNLNKVKLEKLTNSYVFKSPADYILSARQQMTDNLSDRLLTNFQNVLNHNKSRLSNNISKLDALSPLKILSRGFSVIESNGKVVTSTEAVEVGDNLTLTLSDGKLSCTVNSKGE